MLSADVFLGIVLGAVIAFAVARLAAGTTSNKPSAPVAEVPVAAAAEQKPTFPVKELDKNFLVVCTKCTASKSKDKDASEDSKAPATGPVEGLKLYHSLVEALDESPAFEAIESPPEPKEPLPALPASGHIDPTQAIRRFQPKVEGDKVLEPVTVVPFRCLGMCSKPCNISFSAPNKFRYQFGLLNPEDTEVPDAVMGFLTKTYCQPGSLGYAKSKGRPAALGKQALLAQIPPIEDCALKLY